MKLSKIPKHMFCPLSKANYTATTLPNESKTDNLNWLDLMSYSYYRAGALSKINSPLVSRTTALKWFRKRPCRIKSLKEVAVM